jgi:hypothetical protein
MLDGKDGVDTYTQCGGGKGESQQEHEVYNAILETATHVTAKQSYNAGR